MGEDLGKIKIGIVVGTRPEIIMATPLISELKKRNINYTLIHSGQHYDFEMAKVFFKQMKIGEPNFNLEVVTTTEMEQLGDALIKFYNLFKKIKPSVTLVFGDTNTCLAAALSSTRLKIPVAHIEAGNRTGDFTRPEEVNRIMIDHISQLLFCEGMEMKYNLIKEGIEENRIFNVGSIKFDVIYEYKDKVLKDILEKYNIPKDRRLILVTLHRQENVDMPERLKLATDILKELSRKHTLVFPAHPRVKKRLLKSGLFEDLNKNIYLLEPLPYLEFISLLSKSDLVITDSGGVPREAFVFGIPTILFHKSYDLMKFIDRTVFISGYKKDKIIKLAERLLKEGKRFYKNPYGDGRSAEKIIRIITEKKNLLKLPSSDITDD